VQESFLGVLKSHGVAATLRREKGHDIAAACGQLRLQNLDRFALTTPRANVLPKLMRENHVASETAVQ
jgi:hypothetical protein